ncbi:MAG: GxxExxY protein [Chitinispirillaceae bacterium]|nr:GxxExxY protein [Chitinispirillaceae bacterium]
MKELDYVLTPGRYVGLPEDEMPIFYREMHIGTRRVDFFVEGAVMVELKAIEKLEDVHKAQAINYYEAYNISDGLLINFGSKSLEFKRVYNKNLISPNPVHPEISLSDPENGSSGLSSPVYLVISSSCSDNGGSNE